MIDFGLSFAAFEGGSPSPNGSSVKLIQSKMFIPYQIHQTAGYDKGFFDAVKNNEDLTPPKVANEIVIYRSATESGFKDALATANKVVALISHATVYKDNAVGLCFPSSPGDRCIVPKALTIVTTDDGVQAGLNALPPATWDVLENGFAPKAKVVFLAACGIDASFIAQWHLQNGQALIVPLYTVPSENQHMDLYKAAWEWQSMLMMLANGKSVSEAVAEGNTSAASLGAAHRWQVIGDGNANFHASRQ
jgi:hypothetical protein